MFEEKEQQTNFSMETKFVGNNFTSFRDAASQAEFIDIRNEVLKIRRESCVKFFDEKSPLEVDVKENFSDVCDKNDAALNSLRFLTNNLHLQNSVKKPDTAFCEKDSVDEKNHTSSSGGENPVLEENGPNMLSENLSDTSLGSNFDEDILRNVTVDYSNDSLNQFPNVSQLIYFYESKTDDEVLSARGTPTVDLSMVSKVYDEITIDYDWKDVSLLNATEEEHPVVIPPSILVLNCNELRQRLIRLGENPGPISPNTQKVYQRYLAKLEKQPDLQHAKVSIYSICHWGF